MSERDTFASLRRSQEEKYFLEREHELLAKLQRRFALATKLGEMTDETRVANDAILQDLMTLGYTRDTLPLIYLAPIVYVAWAEGFVSAGEHARVLEIARERGIAPGTPAHQQLLGWLAERPSDDLLEKSIGIVQAVMHTHPAAEEAAEKVEMLAEVQRVVDASGDLLLLWHQMTPNERAAINHLVEELGREHYALESHVTE
jgi:hypothetical protein